MILDLNTEEFSSGDTQYDVCIIGGGAAGITLALDLARNQKSVLLLEAGGKEFSHQSQDFYKGTTSGRQYYELDQARLRFLGGTTNHWSGWCRPLDDIDFVQREGVHLSGWPIKSDDISSLYEEVRRMLEIEETAPFERSQEPASTKDSFEAVSFGYSTPVRFGKKYYEDLEKSQYIKAFLNATVLDLASGDKNNSISSVEFRSYRNNKRFNANAKTFVLCLGGLENARFLLIANRKFNGGLGNHGGYVGRCFMEHPAYKIGTAILSRPRDFRVAQHFRLSDPLLKAKHIPQCLLSLEPDGRPPYNKFSGWTGQARRAVKDLVCEIGADDIARKIIGGFECYDYDNELAVVNALPEQMPNTDSYVLLSPDMDSFNQPKLELRWKVLDKEKAALKIGAIEFGKHLARTDIGRLKVEDWVLDEGTPFPPFDFETAFALWHHMGTTRMSDSAAKGVVDKNCRVHGTSNLYIAGSSVFPTSGLSQPTFTILCLALRLSRYLAARI